MTGRRQRVLIPLEGAAGQRDGPLTYDQIQWAAAGSKKFQRALEKSLIDVNIDVNGVSKQDGIVYVITVDKTHMAGWAKIGFTQRDWDERRGEHEECYGQISGRHLYKVGRARVVEGLLHALLSDHGGRLGTMQEYRVQCHNRSRTHRKRHREWFRHLNGRRALLISEVTTAVFVVLVILAINYYYPKSEIKGAAIPTTAAWVLGLRPEAGTMAASAALRFLSLRGGGRCRGGGRSGPPPTTTTTGTPPPPPPPPNNNGWFFFFAAVVVLIAAAAAAAFDGARGRPGRRDRSALSFHRHALKTPPRTS